MSSGETLADRAVAALQAAGQTVATAESLTGGLLCSALVDVPGASKVVRGGVVAYAPEVKVDVLGVDADVVAERGTVDRLTAEQMALGAVRELGADWGVSTTGVAGPEPSEGKPVGTVHVAIVGRGASRVLDLALDGDRHDIRAQTVAAALSALIARVEEQDEPGSR